MRHRGKRKAKARRARCECGKAIYPSRLHALAEVDRLRDAKRAYMCRYQRHHVTSQEARTGVVIPGVHTPGRPTIDIVR